MRFSASIRPVGKMSKRDTVLALMRAAGAEDNERGFLRLFVENPIAKAEADKAWAEGQKARKA